MILKEFLSTLSKGITATLYTEDCCDPLIAFIGGMDCLNETLLNRRIEEIRTTDRGGIKVILSKSGK